MPNLSGYTPSLATNALLGSGIVLVGSSTAYGATQGEPSVSGLDSDFQNLEFDGKLGIPSAGLYRRIVSTPASISGTFIELTDAKAPDLIPGATVTTISTSIYRLTPKNAGDFLSASTDLKTNIFFFVRRGSGVMGVHFPIALVKLTGITGQSQGAAQLSLTFEAAQAANATDVGVSPWSLVIGAATVAAAYTALAT